MEHCSKKRVVFALEWLQLACSPAHSSTKRRIHSHRHVEITQGGVWDAAVGAWDRLSGWLQMQREQLRDAATGQERDKPGTRRASWKKTRK